jgi:hypothetical protein
MLKAATAWEKVGIGITVLTLLYLGVTVVKPGLPSGHDIAAHAIWFKLFNEAIHQGQFPVRWIGLVDTKITGMPLFNFYPVGFYYLASSINIITNSLTESIKLTSLLLWWLSSFFVFLFLLRWGSIPALLGSIIYAYTPYLALDIFVRAAYPEFTALAFWPGIFWATDRLLTTSKTWFIIPLSIFLSLVIISHLPTLIIFTPILISYIIFLVFLNQVTLRSLLKTLFAGLIGVGLASFYLIPSILELSLIQKNYLTFGLYNYTHHFVLPEQLFKQSGDMEFLWMVLVMGCLFK